MPPRALDLTVGAVSVDELRRRAAEGDQHAIAEMARRSGTLTGAAANRLRVGRDQAEGKKMPTASPNRDVAVSRGGKRDRSKYGEQGRTRAMAVVA